MKNTIEITKHSNRLPVALWALTVSIFAIGTTEVVMIGLLTTIADDLLIGVSTAGWIVTSYAIGVAIGGPFVTAFTSGIPRKKLLLAIMLLFIVSNAMATFSSNFLTLIMGRVLSGVAHGVFVGIGANIASSLVSKDKRAIAIAIMFTGLTVAMVTGVPIGTYIGQHFGWRYTFGGISIIGVICFFANYLLLPREIQMGTPINITYQLKVLKSKSILLGFSLTLFSFAALFGTFTYLSPLLETISGFSVDRITLILLLYGFFVALGNMIGGKWSNTDPAKVLFRLFTLLAVIFTLMYFLLPFKVATLLLVAAMGFLGFATVPGMQLYVIRLAEKHLKGAEDVCSVLNISAFNIGIAIGSYLGGVIISSSLGLQSIALMSTAFALIAVIFAIISIKTENNHFKN
ncbi:MFS transporter [Olivibacter ginsenosidimutans]|uniref:MFS transporter n=1 Tax=Olivibacter ginsenosidimutans TaxID=1176537 RepID=A0ABP9B970_9SPHI